MLAQAPPGQPQPAAPTAPLLSPDQLQNLVGRIALYPDDLLGLVLPAATTPLDIVKGQRFLEKYKQDKSLKPDPSLSQPVLSLLAYPEVVNFMDNDLDWTQALGEAVIAQQPDVLQAIQIFRRKAQDAGNLKTDDKQVVVDQQDAVKIVPPKPEVIYVPQYQPSAVVVQQPAPAVTYSSTAYPSYYVPGAAAAAATTGYVAGAATAYGLNWANGAVYSAPYASQSAYNQQQRQNYASQSQQSWQNYSQFSANPATKFSFSKSKRAAADIYYQSGATAAVRQWRPIPGGGKSGTRQQSFSGAQSQSAGNQAQRQQSAGGANLRRRPTRRNARARPARSKDNVKHRKARNIGRAAAVQVARVDKVRVLLVRFVRTVWRAPSWRSTRGWRIRRHVVGLSIAKLQPARRTEYVEHESQRRRAT